MGVFRLSISNKTFSCISMSNFQVKYFNGLASRAVDLFIGVYTILFKMLIFVLHSRLHTIFNLKLPLHGYTCRYVN